MTEKKVGEKRKIDEIGAVEESVAKKAKKEPLPLHCIVLTDAFPNEDECGCQNVIVDGCLAEFIPERFCTHEKRKRRHDISCGDDFVKNEMKFVSEDDFKVFCHLMDYVRGNTHCCIDARHQTEELKGYFLGQGKKDFAEDGGADWPMEKLLELIRTKKKDEDNDDQDHDEDD